MSLERAKKYLEEKGYADHVIELEESSATVQLAQRERRRLITVNIRISFM